MSNSALAAIRTQVMWNRLISVVEEQAQSLLRTAFGTITREAGDLSAGVYDTKGRMIAQAMTGTPGHVNTMATAVAHFFRHFPQETMQPGDVYVTNDPWLGTGHLFDYVMTTPVFLGGLVRRIVDRRRGTEAESDAGPGVLYSSGLVAGGSIIGLLSSFLGAPGLETTAEKLGFASGALAWLHERVRALTEGLPFAVQAVPRLLSDPAFIGFVLFCGVAFLVYRTATAAQPPA